MKKSDMISITLTAMIGVFASWFLVNLFMGNPDEAKATYKDIEVVQPDLAEPNADVFNSDAINPTIEVYVGDCVDVDQDGSLSQAELVACGRVDSLDDSSADENKNESEEDKAEDEDKGEDEDEDEDEDVKVEEETEIENGATNSRNTR